MSDVQQLRVFVSQRLNKALEEILGFFEKTIVKYEEEAALNREVISRQHALLCALNNPLMTESPTAGIFTQQQLFDKDVPCNQQKLRQDVISEPSRVKQKQGDQDLDEVEIIEFTYNSNNSKIPPTLLTSVEPGSVSPSQSGPIDLSSETEDSDDYSRDLEKPTSENTEGLSRPKHRFSCLSCSRTYTLRGYLVRHVQAHIHDSQKICGLCGEQFDAADDLRSHLQTHSRTRKNQIQVRTRSREARLQQLSEVNQNKMTEKPDESSKIPEKKKLRGRPKKDKPNEDEPVENKKRKRKT